MIHPKLKKAIRITAITAGVLMAATGIAIGIAVNFVFTPEKLTPMVVKAANRALRAQLDIRSVELTFFSTFPKFGLEIKDGTLVSKALKDSLWDRTDSLVNFRKCLVEVQPLDYLQDRKISIRNIELEDAVLYAFRTEEGRANWDITRPDSTAQKDTTETQAPEIQEIAIDRIRLRRTSITFDDRDTRIFAQMDSANLDLQAELKREQSHLKMAMDNRNLLLWQDGQLLANRLRTELKTELDLDTKQRAVTFSNTSIRLNGVALDVEGTLQHDSLEKVTDTDLKYRLHAPSLKTVLSMIPETYVKKGTMKAHGEVTLEGDLRGRYGKGQMPTAHLGVTIKKASAHYKGMPYGIDGIDLDFKGYLDLSRKTPSYADLRLFRFEGAHTSIAAKARVNQLLSDPDITLDLHSDINLTALAQTFPLQEGITLKGGIRTNLNAHCRLSDWKRQDFGRIRAQGSVDMKQMVFADRNSGCSLQSDAHFDFSGKDCLAAALAINNLVLHTKWGSSTIRQMKAEVSSVLPKDSARIGRVDCRFEANEIKGTSGDSIVIYGKRSSVQAGLRPARRHPGKPELQLDLTADTLAAVINQRRLGMDKGGFRLLVEKDDHNIWHPKGVVGFENFGMTTPEMKLPIRIHKTHVQLNDQTITLKGTRFNIGRSDLTATGRIVDLYDALKRQQPIKAELELTSELLDGNQLINALNTPEDTTATAAADSLDTEAPMEIFILPKNIDFELKTQLKKVTYGKMNFENVHGAVDIRNQTLHLKRLRMKGLDADMNATLVYHANEQKKGYTGFDFKLEKVNIGKLIEFIPSLDNVVPMLRSFKGIVNFEAAAESKLDSTLNIQVPTLRAAVNIKGDSLVLMDGETFAEISKMMMFKNKKRNLIDSIYVNMTIDKGNVTVYPFVVQMDRYRAAVGGTQDLDMNFKYHISVLKSPVPFKLGINITGTPEKMKFRVGKAKYKDQVTPVAIRKVDSTRINLGRNIVRDFEKVAQRNHHR